MINIINHNNKDNPNKVKTEMKTTVESKLCWHNETITSPIFLLSAASMVTTRLRAVVVDPEVVFVASLMKADAPALVASFQCDFTLQTEEDRTQNMRANLRELKVLACPFIRNKEDKAVTTVRFFFLLSNLMFRFKPTTCESIFSF